MKKKEIDGKKNEVDGDLLISQPIATNLNKSLQITGCF